MEGLIREAIEKVVGTYLSAVYEGDVKVYSKPMKEDNQLAEDELPTTTLFSVCLGLETGINFHTFEALCNKDTDTTGISIKPDLRHYGRDTMVRFFLTVKNK